MQQAISDASHFEIEIDEELKAKPYISDLLKKIIALTICIDFAFYESSGDGNRGLVGVYS